MRNKMTHTPTPNTPTRAQKALSAVCGKLSPDKYIGLLPEIKILEKHLRSALTAPIEKIEGLDQAIIDVTEANINDDVALLLECGEQIETVLKAARLYAQGRTQSAPEGWKLVPIEPTQEMHFAGCDAISLWLREPDGFGNETSLEHPDILEAYKAMLSAAPQFKPQLAALLSEPSILESTPPVTAPIEKVDAWLPIESAPRDGTHILGFGNVDADVDTYEEGQCEVYFDEDNWVNIQGYKCSPTHWKPLDAPPSARLQLQRQGD
jgi:hypothetical protein